MICMNITIRNLHDSMFRKFKAKAAEDDLKLGDALTQAIALWLKKDGSKPRSKLKSIDVFDWGKGTEKTSVEVDKILYG